MAANSGGSGLEQVLSIHLDSLAISPQVKQGIILALLGIQKCTEERVQAQRYVHLTLSIFFSVCSYCNLGSSTSVAQPQAVTEPLAMGSCRGVASAASSGGAHPGYEVNQRPFNSSSGSGYTIWYSSRADSSIQSPPVVPQSKTGHLYIHFDRVNNTYQYWMLSVGGQWETVAKNAQNPVNPDRILSIRRNGEPSWVTRATTLTTEARKDKRAIR
jgi:hypothetical protein